MHDWICTIMRKNLDAELNLPPVHTLVHVLLDAAISWHRGFFPATSRNVESENQPPS
jgi:hypothetical protein